MKRNSITELRAHWNAILASDNLPEEPRLIPRVRQSAHIEAKYEGDLDERVTQNGVSVLAQPPPLPRVKRSGRPLQYDAARAKENATDLLIHGDLTGDDLIVWGLYVAGVSERKIAAQLGVTRKWVRNYVLNRLKLKADVPVSSDYNPNRKLRPWRVGRRHRKAPRAN